LTPGGLVAPFLVPPVNLAMLAALAVALGRRRLAGAALALLLALSLPLVADALTRGLERGEDAGNPADAQAIVVLGAGVVQLADGRTLPDPLTLERLRSAARLARRTGLPVLVAGGVTRAGAAPVARAMADSLRDDFAAPPRWVEDRSADTFENARDAALILQPEHVAPVLVVTHQWHMRRALAAFRAAGLPAIAAPVPHPRWQGPTLDDLIPHATAWLRSYYALHEWIGLAWYSLRARW
jgi:uncharacterized SAM-binding protein YcdF (DUF218 family)